MKTLSVIFLTLFLFVGCRPAAEEKAFDKNDYDFVIGVPVRIIPAVQEDSGFPGRRMLHVEFRNGRFRAFRVWNKYTNLVVIKLRKINKIYYDSSGFIKHIDIEE
jgi:hypothetical protein